MQTLNFVDAISTVSVVSIEDSHIAPSKVALFFNDKNKDKPVYFCKKIVRKRLVVFSRKGFYLDEGESHIVAQSEVALLFNNKNKNKNPYFSNKIAQKRFVIFSVMAKERFL